MVEEFNTEEMKEYIHTLVDYSLGSDEYFIIIARREDDKTPIFYDIEGYPIEDVVTLIESTINEIGE